MNFDNLVASLLGSTATVTVAHPTQSKQKSRLHLFKKNLAKHVIKADSLSRNSPEVEQLLNSTNLEQIESFLKQMGYCDKGITKLYRMFISQESYDHQDY